MTVSKDSMKVSLDTQTNAAEMILACMLVRSRGEVVVHNFGGYNNSTSEMTTTGT